MLERMGSLCEQCICAKGSLRGKHPHVEEMFNVIIKNTLLFVVKIFSSDGKAFIYY